MQGLGAITIRMGGVPTDGGRTLLPPIRQRNDSSDGAAVVVLLIFIFLFNHDPYVILNTLSNFEGQRLKILELCQTVADFITCTF